MRLALGEFWTGSVHSILVEEEELLEIRCKMLWFSFKSKTSHIPHKPVYKNGFSSNLSYIYLKKP